MTYEVKITWYYSDLHKLPKCPYHIVEDSPLHLKNEGPRNANNSQTTKKFKELQIINYSTGEFTASSNLFNIDTTEITICPKENIYGWNLFFSLAHCWATCPVVLVPIVTHPRNCYHRTPVVCLPIVTVTSWSTIRSATDIKEFQEGRKKNYQLFSFYLVFPKVVAVTTIYRALLLQQ